MVFRFLQESLADLKKILKSRGSSLEILFGRPEIAVPALVEAFQAKGIRVEGVWFSKENASEEIQVEQKLKGALEKIGSSLHLVDSRRTMVLKDDLPFDPASKEMPDVYTHFRTKVEALGANMVRSPLTAPDQFKPAPDKVQVKEGPGVTCLSEETTMEQLLEQLLAPLKPEDSERDPKQSDIPYTGGATAGEKRLKHFTEGANAPIATYKETRNGLLGMDFSSKFSPWLAHGNLSPRQIYEQVERHEKAHGASKNTYWVKWVAVLSVDT